MYFGCNAHRWADVSPSVKNMTMVRAYAVAGDWTWPVCPPGTVPLLSIYPPADDFIAGRLDAQAVAFLKAAPASAWLSTYHEPQTYKTVTPGQARAIHARMITLVRNVAPRVAYGSIVMQGTAPSLSQWVIDGLDFYAIDIYENLGGTDAVANRMQRNFAQLPSTGFRAVAETNSPTSSVRPGWFQGIHDWLAANNGRAMLTFWKNDGPDSGPFLPGDTATVNTMNHIALQAKSESSIATVTGSVKVGTQVYRVSAPLEVP